MPELDTGSWLLVAAAALLIGMSKTALPTLGIFVAALMATVFPARESIGIVLPMLLTADVVAVLYYRRNADWKTLFRLIPWVSGGLAGGFIFLFIFTVSRPVEIAIGSIVLAMVLLQLWNTYRGSPEVRGASKLFTAVLGTLAGFTTMIGNAAGPVMAVFLLSAGLTKKGFVGTGAWFFLTVNLIKIPLYTSLGLITTSTLQLNLAMIPLILIGTLAGIVFLKKLPQRLFNIIILLLSVLGALQLLFGT
ncbi:sulfite exporter TauE/SafE family protein [Alkalicoccus chagannorensis]|uniref:sulfite exporter TauE/SafE family protein n=1 Tax=Alkalicoccus chagannorensis TaxID=427072 RepID=UPI0004013BB5|nr:sulfite exporter TauE/SafE family protein [Alkalicoccus chagannorensis]